MLSRLLLAAGLVAGAAAPLAAADRQARTVPLPPGRTLSIEITIGEVRLEGWDRDEALIEIDREVPDEASRDRLPVAIDETDAAVTVRAVQAGGDTNPAYRATVSVRLPRAATVAAVRVVEGRIVVARFDGTLTADIQRGPIDGEDVGGTLRLEAGIGTVHLRRARLDAGGLLRLRAFNGDVRLELARRPADARILALALNGTITSDIPLAMKDTWGPRWGEATLGAGAPVISIDVITGRIEIRSPS